MADRHQLALLRQSVDKWNRWRQAHPELRPDLRGADLHGVELGTVPKRARGRRGAWLIPFRPAAQLSRADLRGAQLAGARFDDGSLGGADLRGACLVGASFEYADLRSADLAEARLQGCRFVSSDLAEANFKRAIVGRTQFVDVDMRDVRGLERLDHMSRSSIGVESILKSQGKIPDGFLRGIGIPLTTIGVLQRMARTMAAEPSCFISHTSKDYSLAVRLRADLQKSGFSCWLAPLDLGAGASK